MPVGCATGADPLSVPLAHPVGCDVDRMWQAYG